MKSDPKLETILSAIAEGNPVDWEQTLESTADRSERRTLEALRVLARVQNLATPAEPPVPARWGSLEILERIGSGGFASVFRALDPVLDLEVALKILHQQDPSANAEIIGEGRRLARLRHPNVVRIFGVEELAGRVGLRMELIRGLSLDRVVRENGPLGPIEAVRIGLEVCRALAAVHAAGLVHRDVKAQNVMREEDGRVVLMDLGAGVETGPPTGSDASPTGTPLYLAPEILRNEDATPATDLYALGVLLFFLVSGRFPVEGPNLDGVRRAHVEGKVSTLEDLRPGLPARFLEVVRRALDPEATSRFESAASLATNLAATLAAPWGTGRTRGVQDSRDSRDSQDSQDLQDSRDSQDSRGNLPPSLTRFIGRKADLESVGDLIRNHRLITLTGPGGCGKTRLALETCASLIEAFEDGVWFVPLAPVRDERGVTRALGTVLGVQETAGEPLLDGVVRSLGGRRALVLIDNCEHLVDSVARLVSDLLVRVPSAVLLSTSRVALEVTGEMTYEVSPLEVLELPVGTVPSATGGEAGLVERVARSESVELFVDRAQSVKRGFVVDPSNARAVAKICHGLDGLPLALELAAARIRSISVEDLAERLDTRLDLLRSGPAPDPLHHQTLYSSIAWSYDLLRVEERAVLRSLSIFAGGWTLAAAEAVIPKACGVPERDVIRVLSSAVSRSLVHLNGSKAHHHRYDMLATVREFMRQRLDEEGSRVATTRAFVDYYVELSKTCNQSLMGSGDVDAMKILTAEHDNIRSACRATIAGGDLATGFVLARQLGRFWMNAGHYTEGRRLCEELLSHPDAPIRTPERASVASWRAVFAARQLDPEVARHSLRESLDIFRAVNDRRGEAVALNGLGVLEYDAGNYTRARALLEESLALRRELEEKRGIAQSLTNLGLCHAADDRLDAAIEDLEGARAIHEESGNAWGVAKTLGSIGLFLGRQGRTAEALQLLERGLAIQAEIGPGTALYTHLGYVHLWSGLFAEARSAFTSAIRSFEGTTEPSRPSGALRGLALIVARSGDPGQAARLLGAAKAERRVVLTPWQFAETAEAEEALRDRLGDESFEQEFETGAADPGTVCAEALAITG